MCYFVRKTRHSSTKDSANEGTISPRHTPVVRLNEASVPSIKDRHITRRRQEAAQRRNPRTHSHLYIHTHACITTGQQRHERPAASLLWCSTSFPVSKPRRRCMLFVVCLCVCEERGACILRSCMMLEIEKTTRGEGGYAAVAVDTQPHTHNHIRTHTLTF